MSKKQEIMTLDQIIEMKDKQVIEAFTTEGGLEFITDPVDYAVDNFTHDLTTKAGRARTTALATKVGKVSKRIEDTRKVVTADLRAKVKEIDGYGKVARDHLSLAKVRARAPLTKVEAEEAEKLQLMQKIVFAIDDLGITVDRNGVELAIGVLRANYEALDAIIVDENEFPDQKMELGAFKARKHSMLVVHQAITREEARLNQEEELATLRAAAAEQKLKDQEAEEERQEEERKRQQAEREKELVEKAKADAEEAKKQAVEDAKRAEYNRIEAEKKAASDALIAAENAKNVEKQAKADAAREKKAAKKREKEAAEQAREEERKRQADEKAEEKRLQEERDADLAHVEEVKNGAARKISKHAQLPMETAHTIVELINDKQIPGVTISY